MVKRFKVLMLVALIMPVVAFSGCEILEKEKDVASSALLLVADAAGTGSITTEHYGKFAASGFSDPGSGTYQLSALNGSRQIWIVLSGGHAVGSYDQNNVDVTYYDDSYTWVTVTGQAFSLTIDSWSGAGGYTQGSFCGQVERADNPGYHMSLCGTFNVKIMN
jgi:hypothetical protein